MKTFLPLSVYLLLSCSIVAQLPKLESGRPIQSGYSDGLSPLSFGHTYTNRPLGYAYLSSKECPDLFVLVNIGYPESQGLYLCQYDGLTKEGNLIYKKPRKVSHPWADASPTETADIFRFKDIKMWHEVIPPASARVFQYKEKVFGLWLLGKTMKITQYNQKSERFEQVVDVPLSGLPSSMISFDILPMENGKAELVMLCGNGVRYGVERASNEDAQSLYSGAEIYRGKIPYAGLYSAMLNLDNWTIEGEAKAVSADRNVILSGSSVAAVASSDKQMNGYLIQNRLGSLKYLPRSDKKASSLDARYVRNSDRNVLVTPNNGAQMIPFVSPERQRCTFISGGEGAFCTYTYMGQTAENEPIFGDKQPILQRDADLYAGSLTVPCVVDWDGDGVDDVVAGNSEGRLLFFKNEGTTQKPSLSMGREVDSGGKPICFRPGYHVVQGPMEASWGYLCPTVADWNNDGLLDVIFSGSRAKFEVMMNRGTKTEPKLDQPIPLSVDNLELCGTWRVRPAVTTIEGKSVILIMDGDNALHLYRRVDDYHLEDLGKVLMTNGKPITGHNNKGEAMGQWGRGEFAFTDWDGDGRIDLLVGCVRRSSYPDPERGLPCSRYFRGNIGMSVLLLKNVGTNSNMLFEEPVQFQFRGTDFYLGAHSNGPTPCSFGDNTNGPNLLVGVESGKFFFFDRRDITTIGIDE